MTSRKRFPKCQHREKLEVRLPNSVFAHRLFILAREYENDGKMLIGSNGSAWRPAYFLICHAIELFLKSYLASINKITNLSNERFNTHCLSCLYKFSIDNGLVIEFENCEKILNHVWDYTEITRFPDIVMIQRLTPEEIVNVCAAVHEAVQKTANMTFIKGALHGSYEAIQMWHARPHES